MDTRKDCRTRPRPGTAARSTGVGRNSEEPVGEALGQLMKGVAFSAGMAADLAVVEDQGQGIGQKPDHGQHHQGGGLVDRGVFEVTVGGDGLKDFGIDSPTAATQLMKEQGRDRAQVEIGSVEVSAGEQDRGLAFNSSSVFSPDRDPTLLFDANRFDHPYLAIGDRRPANRPPASASIESPGPVPPERRWEIPG